MSNETKLINNYINDFYDTLQQTIPQTHIIKKIINTLKLYSNSKNSVHIFGNGGSASIASHFSLDLTNNTKIRCHNYNEASLITCFSNDYGYQNWVAETIKKFTKKNDLLVLISSSGKSENMINAVKEAKKKKIGKIITLSGFDQKNPLKKIGDINLHVESNNYNVIENVHQIWLLMIVDILKKN